MLRLTARIVALFILALGGLWVGGSWAVDGPLIGGTPTTQEFTFVHTDVGTATYTIPDPVTVTVTVTGSAPPPPPPPTTCTRTQAGGSLQTFVSTAQPGEILCWSGTYTSGLVIGSALHDFTLRVTPGLTGAITRGGTSFSVVEITGDYVTLYGFDISGSGTKNCILIGLDGGETNPALFATRTTLDHLRVHTCGNDNHEHGIYVDMSSFLHVTDSWFYGAGGYGIQFYPEADDSLVEYSVIDGNDTATNFAGSFCFCGEIPNSEYNQAHQPDRNVVANSLITFVSPGSSTQQFVMNWPGIQGVGNTVTDSCVYSPGDAEVDGPGLTETNITRQDPLYSNRSVGDYTLQANSPCLGKGPR